MAAAVAVAARPAPLGVWLLLGVLVSAALLFVLVGLGIRPVRLYRAGVEFSKNFRTTFWRYDDIRDAYLLRDRKGRPTGLIITHRDGRSLWGGTLWTGDAAFRSGRLEEIANFIRNGIAEHGAGPTVDWSASAWKSLQPLVFRGAIVVRLEAMAASHGVMVIDEDYVRRAVEQDKTLRLWFSASLGAPFADRA